MPTKRTSPGNPDPSRSLDEALAARQEREQSYRGRALKIFPPICARCGREFSGKRLRELTVHHKDHNHDNNPPDGSNWVLLCIYCHDNEHQREVEFARRGDDGPPVDTTPPLTQRPFANIADLLRNKS